MHIPHGSPVAHDHPIAVQHVGIPGRRASEATRIALRPSQMTAHVLREEGLKTRKVVAAKLPKSHSDRPSRPGGERAHAERKSRQIYVAHSTVDPIASDVSNRRERGKAYVLRSDKTE